MPIGTLILGLEGVVVDTADVHRLAYNHAFADMGIGWTWTRSVFAGLLDIPDGEKRVRAFALDFRPGMLADLEQGGMVEEIVLRKRAYFEALVTAGAAPLRPGVERFLSEASGRGAPLALISRASTADTMELLEARLGRGAQHRFRAIVTRDKLEGEDSASGWCRSALSVLGLGSQPDAQHILVHDSPDFIAAGRAEGLTPIAVPSIYTAEASFECAALAISDFGQRDAPFRRISGDTLGHRMVTLGALAEWSVAYRVGSRALAPAAT